MAVQSAKSFLSILERSGIVSEDLLKSTLKELSQKFNGRMVKLDDLTKHLIESGLVTAWHCEKLLAGRYKGFFLGKYKLLKHLGTGGMSSVYLAEHRLSGHRRAIKVLPRKKVDDKSYLDRFYREGKAAASLDNNNIVRIYDICNDNNTHYMVMEYVAGQDLYEKVKQEGPLDPQEAVQLVMQAVQGLAHAHQRNLVHRDIKPANLLLSSEGTVKILDLGLALIKESDEESLTMLHGERVMGTADYLSPEQALDSHNIDHRADIYSMGCTLYYLLTGQPPFPTGTLAQRVNKHCNEYPTSLRSLRPECPEPLIQLCERMMRKKPANRFSDCDPLLDALREYLETGQVILSPEPELPDLDFSNVPTSNSSGLIGVDTSSSARASSTRLEKPSDGIESQPARPVRKELMPIWAMVVIIVMAFTALVLSVLIAQKWMAKVDQRRSAMGYNCRLASPMIDGTATSNFYERSHANST